LHLALEALGVTHDDEVIIPTYTFTATAEVVRYLGAKPVFVDVEESTYNIDANKLERAITQRSKAIIPVHIAGLACNMELIHDVSRKKGLAVIEDAAHACPSYYKGKIVGSLGSDATVFSFYATKTITTGEGGMIVTDNEDLTRRCKVMRLHGIDRDVFNRYRSDRPSWKYEVVAPGYKYNMTDIAASMGLHQLKKAEKFRQRRAKIASLYNEELGRFSEYIRTPYSTMSFSQLEQCHAWHLYILAVNPQWIARDEFVMRMAEAGIGTSVHFIPLHLHPYWGTSLNHREGAFPVAEKLYRNAVSLPIYSKMTDRDVDRVISAIKSIVER
jgi:dTDP-4-amino-4,6-dideoxygalactose transaminase